jgi:hypothetical protein
MQIPLSTRFSERGGVRRWYNLSTGGQLECSIFHALPAVKSGIIAVHCHRAEDIVDTSIALSQDPYVQAFLLPHGSSTEKPPQTSVSVGGGADPQWDDANQDGTESEAEETGNGPKLLLRIAATSTDGDNADAKRGDVGRKRRGSKVGTAVSKAASMVLLEVWAKGTVADAFIGSTEVELSAGIFRKVRVQDGVCRMMCAG